MLRGFSLYIVPVHSVEYLAVDSGGYLCREAKCSVLSSPEDWILRYIRTYLVFYLH